MKIDDEGSPCSGRVLIPLRRRCRGEAAGDQAGEITGDHEDGQGRGLEAGVEIGRAHV